MEIQIYKYIVEDIRNKIKTGKFLVNEKIPTEIELMAYYDTSKSTVRKAMNILCNEGYVNTVPRIGYYVNEPKVDEYIITFDEIGTLDTTDQIEIINSEIKHSSDIDILSEYIPKGLKVLEVQRVIESSGIPVAYDVLNIIYAKNINRKEYESENCNLFETLAKKISIFQMEKDISFSGCIPTQNITRLLYIKEDEPLIQIEQRYWDKYNKLIAFEITYCRSNYVNLIAESI